MRTLGVITRRELGGYFSTPLAYVFIVIFLAGTGAVTFYLGNFFGRRQADLLAFFSFHPWLFLVLIPAVGMRLWAEERKSGTIELLMTLPVTTGQVVAGKFLAAWAFTTIAVALTFPIWISVNYLGDPDNGVIVASYLGSLLMAGGRRFVHFHDERIGHCSGLFHRLGAGVHSRLDCLAVVPDPFPDHYQGRDPSPIGYFLLINDGGLPVHQRTDR